MIGNRRQIGRALGAGLVVAPLLTGCFGHDSETQPRTATQLLEKGTEAYEKDDLHKAKRFYESAIRLDPASPFGYYDLGLVEQAKARAPRAEKNYRHALILDPNFAPALFNLAILRSQAGATDEAINLYQQVITLTPSNAGAHFNLGLLLSQLGRPTEAAEQLTRAIELNPKLAKEAAENSIDHESQDDPPSMDIPPADPASPVEGSPDHVAGSNR